MRRCLPAAPFRVMNGYLPRWQATRCPELAAPLSRDVGIQAIAIAKEAGLNVIA
jgi:uncharacterized Fe-S radical SAM superfamily protein PflX